MQDSNPRKQSYEQNRAGGQRRDNFNQKQRGKSIQQELLENNFKEEWIKNGTDSEMIKYAEDAGKFMADNKLTNSKIRSIYGEIKRIQMAEFEKERASFLLLRPKVAYALGRDDSNRGLQLFKSVFDKASIVVKDQKTFDNFCNLFEAILAYHKAHGGKD